MREMEGERESERWREREREEGGGGRELKGFKGGECNIQSQFWARISFLQF